MFLFLPASSQFCDETKGWASPIAIQRASMKTDSNLVISFALKSSSEKGCDGSEELIDTEFIISWPLKQFGLPEILNHHQHLRICYFTVNWKQYRIETIQVLNKTQILPSVFAHSYVNIWIWRLHVFPFVMHQNLFWLFGFFIKISPLSFNYAISTAFKNQNLDR